MLGSGDTYTLAHGTPPRMDSADGKSPPRPRGLGLGLARQTFSIDAGGELYAVEADDFAATVLDDPRCDDEPRRLARQHARAG